MDTNYNKSKESSIYTGKQDILNIPKSDITLFTTNMENNIETLNRAKKLLPMIKNAYDKLKMSGFKGGFINGDDVKYYERELDKLISHYPTPPRFLLNPNLNHYTSQLVDKFMKIFVVSDLNENCEVLENPEAFGTTSKDLDDYFTEYNNFLKLFGIYTIPFPLPSSNSNLEEYSKECSENYELVKSNEDKLDVQQMCYAINFLGSDGQKYESKVKGLLYAPTSMYVNSNGFL